ncbi:hypothetical protein BDV95DRAFT_572305 [Massariosphaeria phaeospora]|uniref:RING-type domain-containing protein n=1 Tax=Massariosphaeria phaeospora TaxID=100035 RepID=A0A7C8I9M3_9PLEO|nr:hypothetical protein BDV95DRAFT_572305 [Massariosphaeria phaeospora]
MAKQVAHHCPDVVGLPYVSLLEGRTAAFDTAGGSNVHRAMGFSIDIAAISNQCSRAAAREECAICCYRQNSTTLRICGNTFCEACINVWLNGSGSHGATGSCPICRTDLTVPQAEVQQYPRLEAQQ